MPNTTGNGTSFLEYVLQMTTATPANGSTFDGIHQQLVNNDTFLKNLITGTIAAAVNSGVVEYVQNPLVSGTTGAKRGQVYLATQTNFMQIVPFTAIINGALVSTDHSMSGSWNNVPINPPQATNITPALPGSAGDTLVFLEAWRSATDGSWQTRFRVVDGVDFGTYPEGLGVSGSNAYNVSITPQGGLASPPTTSQVEATMAAYSKMFYRNLGDSSGAVQSESGLNRTDAGLYVAGNGSTTSQSFYNTLDGYVYAIPLFRVRRRNSAAFDPDNNPLGGKQYYTVNATCGAWAVGTSQTLTLNTGASNVQVGDTLALNGTVYFKVTAVSSTTATVTVLSNTGTTTANFYPLSDRPDGLYSNVIDASDIQGGDLRHQVFLTGHNDQALLESSLDKLLRGQLITNAPVRYAREYIGLQKMTDDVNTLLLANFDGGSVNGTANGAAVSGTVYNAANGQTVASPAFSNGVQGLALNFTSESYTCEYPISLASGANTYTVEMAFKTAWAWNDGVNHGLWSMHSAGVGSMNYGTAVVTLAKTTSGNIQMNINQQANSTGTTPFFGETISVPANLASTLTPGTWVKISLVNNNGIITVTLNGVLLATYTNVPALALAVQGFCLSQDYAYGGYVAAPIDSVRVSNIARSETQLPANFNGANGDHIVDGPSGDANFWSDDQGGTTLANNRTNPYGLARVPNQIAARVSYNGSEIRHYYGQGVTPGWTVDSYGGTNPTGCFDVSAEFFGTVSANESADGARTTFTFTKPANATGLWLLYQGYTLTFQAPLYTWVTPTSMSIDTTGKVTITLASAPSSTPVMYYATASRHSHFVPSTKGFILHDWMDDSLAAGATPPTVFQTTKYNVTSINHVRVNGTVQNGGYSTAGLSARGTVTAMAAAGATTLTLSAAGNFVNNQNIRVQTTAGTWYTTTISSGGGTTTLTIPATPAGTTIPANAVIEGAALVTFTTAPAANAIVDLVYESVLTPSLGDYVRIHYQHTPYQGTLDTNVLTVLHVGTSKGFVTTKGTGMVDSSPDGSWTDYFPALSTQLPINGNDYALKRDTLALSGPTFSTAVSTFYGNEQVNEHTSSTSVPTGHLVSGSTLTVRTGTSTNRGVSTVYLNDNLGNIKYPQVSLRDLTTAIPHLAGVPLICMDNSTGELLLVVITQLNTSTANEIRIVGPGAMDTFKLPGRPLIKGYGGLAA